MSHSQVAVIDKLLAHWKEHPPPLGTGASGIQIATFEQAHSMQLPEDFTTYLKHINGFVRTEDPYSWNDICAEGFYFYPLLEMKRATDSSSRYIFCHNALTLQDYAIELGVGPRNGNVDINDGESGIYLAGSFAEFVELYVVNSMQLYSGSEAPDA